MILESKYLIHWSAQIIVYMIHKTVSVGGAFFPLTKLTAWVIV